MSHILLNRINSFNRTKLESPHGYTYNTQSGMWVSQYDEQDVLVKSTIPGRPIRGTKKQDVETGEDQKGQ
jgi:hypothetical protein